jgi:glycosyltransferase involved in cell wall biosynthesis
MKIALISYEYPPDTAHGGIGTYAFQAARMLHARGHHVEVFAGSHDRTYTASPDGFPVHRVKEPDLRRFSEPIGRVFADRHAAVAFDVIEGPDFAADAREAVRLVPDIPLVLKLHTPTIMLFRLNYLTGHLHPLSTKIRLYVSSVAHGIRPRWGFDPAHARYRAESLRANETERLHALDADEIASPSTALGQILAKEWGLDREKVAHVPYPYLPSEDLLRIPADTRTGVVTFVGRLEVRKGVLDLARAIPSVLRCCAGVKFRFVGPSDESPLPGMDMEQYLKRALRKHAHAVEFTGPVPLNTIPDILATTDITVFPSIWENFPLVCLESMAAARAVVGSNAGGMSDMLDDGKVGRLVPPGNPAAIATALISLLRDPASRTALGIAARDRLVSEYRAERIGAIQEASYRRAIERRRASGPRATVTGMPCRHDGQAEDD